MTEKLGNQSPPNRLIIEIIYLFMEQVLKGQIAVITGASSGIGAGVAKSLAAAGAT